MKWIIICGVIVIFQAYSCTPKNLPSFIKRCKRTDPTPVLSKCIAQRAEDLKPYLIKGIPEMKLPSIEPLRIPKLAIHTGNGTSVGFHAIITNIAVYGVKDFQVEELIMDLEKPYIFLHLHIPNLYIQVNYAFSGKILLLELSSTGKGYLNITDVDTKSHHRNLSIETRNGMEYLNMNDDEIEYIKYASGSVYFDNLFEGNPLLAEQTNQAMNDNFDEMGKEFSPLIYESVRRLVLGTIKPVFDAYSLNELLE